MPEFYEHAARLSYMLIQIGVKISPGIDSRTVVHRIAVLIEKYIRENSALSHAGAAEWIMADIEKRGLISCSQQQRAKLCAIIGTTVANIQIERRAA